MQTPREDVMYTQRMRKNTVVAKQNRSVDKYYDIILIIFFRFVSPSSLNCDVTFFFSVSTITF